MIVANQWEDLLVCCLGGTCLILNGNRSHAKTISPEVRVFGSFEILSWQP
jgi:hypothetical protein